MARKHKGGRKRQGVTSWLTSLIALIIGLFPALFQLGQWFTGRQTFGQTANELNARYNPLAGDRAKLAEGYGALGGGIIFKAATTELTRRAQIRSLVPAMR